MADKPNRFLNWMAAILAIAVLLLAFHFFTSGSHLSNDQQILKSKASH